ncbi:MAG: hypothetical protein ABSD59_09800 [Terracidiphilus sp.]
MPTCISQQPESSRCIREGGRTCATTHRRRVLFATWATLFAAQFFVGVTLAAQTPATPAPATTQPSTHPRARSHKKPAAEKPAAPPAPVPVPAALVALPLPDWPANNKPVEATVVWDSHGLLIQASNSSLDQILRDISLKIGAKVEGMGADQRIFGVYGPGPARDVLSQLLDGSGYNVLLVGDQGQGTPRRIVLSGRPNGQPSDKATPVTGSGSDAENDQDTQQMSEQEQPQPAEPIRPGMPGFIPGQPVPIRTQQQMMEQRQQQLQQMQQQQQNNPQNSQN